MERADTSPPAARLTAADGVACLELSGDWTVLELERLPFESALAALGDAAVRIDGSRIGRLDSAGAALLWRLLESQRAKGLDPGTTPLPEAGRKLLDYVAGRRTADPDEPAPVPSHGRVERLGRWAVGLIASLAAPVVVIGRLTVAVLRRPWRARRLRPAQMAHALEASGLRALPLVSLLAFLLGLVVAYQGGVQLAAYGASPFLLELTALTMFRELAPLITAIIVAGRSGAAYAAELATMTINEEIDALSTLGVDAAELLVLPRVVGLTLSVTLLTVAADAASLAGGLLAAVAFFDFDAAPLLARVPAAVTLTPFVIGVAKAPLFGALIALVACAQGLSARGGADAVGRHTTDSVVQSIFLVVVSDAAISIALSAWGI